MQDRCDTLLPHLRGNYGQVTNRSGVFTGAKAGPDWHAALARQSGSWLSQLMCMQPLARLHGWVTPG